MRYSTYTPSITIHFQLKLDNKMGRQMFRDRGYHTE